LGGHHVRFRRRLCRIRRLIERLTIHRKGERCDEKRLGIGSVRQ
jgi:hypothetical protein